jgi:3',5'-cyclic AMP phosphodiesterase CpdA
VFLSANDSAKLTIVAISDTHTFHDRLEVPDGDVLVHAGDMCQTGSLDELTRARDFLAALPHPHKIVVAGNHDVAFEAHPDEARRLFEGFLYLQDEARTIKGVTFYGSPWMPRADDWAFMLPRGAPLAEKWAMIPDDTDVLVTHVPPRGIGDEIGAEPWREGCADLLQRVRQVAPRLHIFGHVHRMRGRWRIGPTTFVNANTDEGLEPVTVIRYPPDFE